MGRDSGVPVASGSVVVAGSLAQRPGIGGHAWVFLQYLLGFRRLGYDVLFADQLDPALAVDAAGRPCPVEASVNARYLASVMADAGLDDSWTLLTGADGLGVPRREVIARTRGSALLLNVMGYLRDDDVLAAAPLRVFLDIDPGFGQMWRALGLADLFTGHDRYVTVGENIGRPGCRIPTVGVDWIPSRPPVVLSEWPVTPPPDRPAFTSVGSWRGPFGPVEYDGEVYGLRVHEFRRFLTLPRDTGAEFRVALDIDEVETRDLTALDENEWMRIDPRAVARTPADYRRWIQGSAAEFLVAKNMYVATRGGWFSDRSACYLASGRPVLAQDTGLADLYPVGEGLVTFTDRDEAVDGAHDIARNWTRHSAAARRVAEECFDSDRVLRRLLDQVS